MDLSGRFNITIDWTKVCAGIEPSAGNCLRPVLRNKTQHGTYSALVGQMSLTNIIVGYTTSEQHGMHWHTRSQNENTGKTG
ncbi:hypothetical protein L211DRAFT_837706, partial [Terfezia boudieri ATCC MYA-4762]